MKELVVFTILVFIVFTKYLGYSSHIMMLLLSLEMSMMVSYILLSALPLGYSVSPIFIIYFFVLNVMEAALGLSMLVCMARNYGDECHTDF